MNLRHSFLAVLVAVLWGINFVAIDLGLHTNGRDVPPLLFVAMRFLLVVFPFIFFIRKPDVGWKAIIGVGLFMSAGQFGLLYLGMALGMPAGLASLVLQAQVLFTVLLAARFLGEKPSRRQLVGVALGIAGLAVVALGRSAVAPVLPLMIVLAAALSWAVGNVVARHSKAASGLGLVVWSGAVVPLPLAGLSLLVDGPGVVWGTLTDLQCGHRPERGLHGGVCLVGGLRHLEPAVVAVPELRRRAFYAAGSGGGHDGCVAGPERNSHARRSHGWPDPATRRRDGGAGNPKEAPGRSRCGARSARLNLA